LKEERVCFLLADYPSVKTNVGQNILNEVKKSLEMNNKKTPCKVYFRKKEISANYYKEVFYVLFNGVTLLYCSGTKASGKFV